MATTLLAAAAKSVAGTNSTVAKAVDALPTIMTNVSSPERWASLVAGGVLAGYGLMDRKPSLLWTGLGAYLLYRGLTGNCPAYQSLGLSASDSTAENTAVAAGHGTHVEHAIVVRRPVNVVFDFWRDFERLPQFMNHLIDVDTTTDGKSHWVARGPLGIQVEWDAEIINEVPNHLIAWKSLPGADVDTAGSVRFRPVPGGTEVRVNLKYDPPGGQLGTAIAGLFGENPHRQVREDLFRFKQIMEGPQTPQRVVGG
jgi:uncharacterized membrane protein